MPPARVVPIVAALVGAPLAGFVSAWAAKHLPGITIPKDQLSIVFTAGVVGALGLTGLWQRGRAAYEKLGQVVELKGLEAEIARHLGEHGVPPDPVLGTTQPDPVDDSGERPAVFDAEAFEGADDAPEVEEDPDYDPAADKPAEFR